MTATAFGNPAVSQSTCNGAPNGYVANNTDCDDTNDDLNPNTVWFLDADGDNYYIGTGMTQCVPLPARATATRDCWTAVIATTKIQPSTLALRRCVTT
jgi:hypothetical protein